MQALKFAAALVTALLANDLVAAQSPAPLPPTPGRISQVTVYQNTALITREVPLPEAAGLVEVVVSPLPPTVVPASIYAEGSDGVRILSARFRTRAIAEDTREEVRKLEASLKELNRRQGALQAELKVAEQNLAMLAKLENFTTATLTTLTEKGQLDSEKIIALVNFIRDSRLKQTQDETTLRQTLETLREQAEFTKRQIQELSGGATTRTERDAVIAVDKPNAGAAAVRLNYLVQQASWRPQYKLRAGLRDGDRITLEYQAAVMQQTGEDWTTAAIELSTAQPLRNAAPPDLRVLEISVGGGNLVGSGAVGDRAAAPAAAVQELQEQSRMLKGRAATNMVQNRQAEAGKDWNEAAALDQFRDLLLSREDLARGEIASDFSDEGPSVTFALKSKMTLPSRNDEHVVEIARLELEPRFYYKAVPLLTQHVYRIAQLINTTEYVLLPGEATMYLGRDFVGQTRLPLVAVGKTFSAGFGVDPQIQVSRKLLDKSRTTQGGNQVLKFQYQILLNSYKSAPVEVQVWDRLPHAEAQQTIAVTLVSEHPKLSTDPLYLRDDRPKNLLRWDVQLDPAQHGEKAMAISYEYRLELDRNINIGGFMAK